ncbi:MAG: hypothetical protein AAF288_03200 [Planctomycetota bacterium]
MTATATTPALTPEPIRDPPAPAVWIDGHPEPRLQVRRWTQQGPLDLRHAELVPDPSLPDSVWRNRTLLVATPRRLVDGRTLLAPHLAGAAQETQAKSSSESIENLLHVVDDEAHAIAQPIANPLGLDTLGRIVASPGAILNTGPRANRSTEPAVLPQGAAYLPQTTGEPWTFAQALHTLTTLANLNVDTRLIPLETQNATLANRLELRRPLEDLLRVLLDPLGLTLRLSLTSPNAGDVFRQWTAAPVGLNHAGPIDAAELDPKRTPSIKRTATRRTARSRQWIARAQGVEIESTFPLVPAWPAADQNQPNNTYARSHPDFASVANVFRLWTLNHDAAQPGAPFDLLNFFGVNELPPGVLRFRETVALDSSGRPFDPIVESSFDQGATWGRVSSGNLSVRSASPAIYLTQTTLAASWLDANRAGDARLRITATLRSPAPLESARWRGNPFRGVDPPNVLDFGDAFRVRRIDPQSIHYAGVQAGQVAADLREEKPQLDQALLDRLDASDRLPPESAALDVTLAGLCPGLGPGDRVDNPAGPRRAAGRIAQPLADRPAVVQRIERRVDQAQTRLTIHA